MAIAPRDNEERQPTATACRSTDAFVLESSSDSSALVVYLFNDAFRFVRQADAAIASLRNVRNVAPADFNYDGLLDVMVLVQLPPLDAPHPRYQIAVYLQTENHQFSERKR